MASTQPKATPSYSKDTQAALLKAVRLLYPDSACTDSPLTVYAPKAHRVFDLERTARSLDELTNGALLADILHQLDPEFDPSQLEAGSSTSKYLNNKRNIQIIYKGLFRFIRRQVPDLSCQAKKFDYHAIAENPDAQGMSQVRRFRKWLARPTFTSRPDETKEQSLINESLQLLVVMLSAAILGPENGKYIGRVQSGALDPATLGEIMRIITMVQEDAKASKDDEDLDEAIEAVMEARDIDLLVEEQNAALRKELELANKKLTDYITRLEYLQGSHDELRYEKSKNDNELETLRKATQDGTTNTAVVKNLEAQVNEQMEMISHLEERIRDADREKTQLEAEVQRLTHKSAQFEELQDQVSEWRHKAEDLEKKANTAERYKQKLESQQYLEKENQNLKYECADLLEQNRLLSDDKDRGSRSKKAEEEYTKMLELSEQHLQDIQQQKGQLLREMAALHDQVARLENQRSHDETFIQDLQDQIQQGTTAVPRESTDGAGVGLNLEDELNGADSDDQPAKVSLDYSRLKAENDLLKRSMGSSGDTILMRHQLEDAKANNERIQASYNEFFEKYHVAQAQIEALLDQLPTEQLVHSMEMILTGNPDFNWFGSDFHRTTAFAEQRVENIRLTNELEKERKRIEELEARNGDQSRELLQVKTDLAAVGKEGIEALEELKNTDGLVAESLTSEMERLREQLNIKRSEADAQKSQLIEALLAKDKLRKDAEDGKEIQEAIAKDPDASEASKKENEKIDKLRARLLERNEVSDSRTSAETTWSGFFTRPKALAVFPEPLQLPPPAQVRESEPEMSSSQTMNGFGYTPGVGHTSLTTKAEKRKTRIQSWMSTLSNKLGIKKN